MKSTRRATWSGLAALSAFLLLVACKPAATEGASAASTAPVAAKPGTPEAPREIKIEVGDSMKFSVTRIEAAPGETLRLLLVNTGAAPKEAMGHNWVLLAAGVDATAYVNAAVGARATDYLPEARAADVIAHTKLLGGGARDAVIFTAPATPGDYTYVCTFPAHLQLGMKGVLAVK
jgi:azurin